MQKILLFWRIMEVFLRRKYVNDLINVFLLKTVKKKKCFYCEIQFSTKDASQIAPYSLCSTLLLLPYVVVHYIWNRVPFGMNILESLSKLLVHNNKTDYIDTIMHLFNHVNSSNTMLVTVFSEGKFSCYHVIKESYIFIARANDRHLQEYAHITSTKQNNKPENSTQA